jgi:hypothetical protein
MELNSEIIMNENGCDPTLIMTFMREIPIVSDSRYEDWRNPAIYTKETSIAIQDGELLLKVILLDAEGQKVEDFPSYVPISLLAQAALKQNPVSLKLNDKTINLKLCVTGFENESEKYLFKLFLYSTMNYIIYPDQEKPLPRNLKCLKDHRVTKAKIAGNDRVASLYEKVYEEGSKEWDILDQAEMEHKFSRIRFIKKGGDASVFEVERTSTLEKRALKITKAPLNPYLLPCIKSIVNLGLTPHLTPVEDFFIVPGNQNPFDVSTSLRAHRCYVMEKLTGEFLNIPKDADNGLQNDIFDIQLAATLHMLKKLRVRVEDFKGRNILYKELDETDLYKGKRLIDFDYWKYTVHSLTFYVPRPKFLIKLADYDDWQIELFNTKSKSSFFRWNKILSKPLEVLVVIFSKPNIAESKIIEI